MKTEILESASFGDAIIDLVRRTESPKGYEMGGYSEVTAQIRIRDYLVRIESLRDLVDWARLSGLNLPGAVALNPDFFTAMVGFLDVGLMPIHYPDIFIEMNDLFVVDVMEEAPRVQGDKLIFLVIGVEGVSPMIWRVVADLGRGDVKKFAIARGDFLPG